MHILRKLIECLGEARFLSKRLVGISTTRRDGSNSSTENDIQALGAEYFATTYYGYQFNSLIGPKGDGGADFVLSLDVDVVWFGMQDGKPRENGNLIINIDEPKRWADIYVLVKGSIETKYEIMGWTTHKRLIKEPIQEFNGVPKYAMHISKLSKPEVFRSLKKDWLESI